MNNFITTVLIISFASLCQAQSFDPSDYGPALWLDAADSATVVHTAGVVSVWNDKSGNGNHVSESDISHQPEYLNTAEGIYFDGSDLLMGNNSLGYGSDTTITIFVAVNVATGASKGSVIAKGQWTSGADYRIELGKSGFDATLQDARKWNSSGGSWDIAHKNMFSSAFTLDKTVYYYLNTSTSFTKSPVYNVSYNPNNSPFSIGGRFNYGNYFQGEILEVILYQRELDICERRNVEGYLINKWGMQAFITTNHPFKDNDFGICDEFQFRVPENSPNGTVVDTVRGTYFNSTVTFSDWRIEKGGLYDGMFAINDSTGVLTVSDNTHLDYEQVSACYIEVSALANNATRVYGGADIEITDQPDGDPPKIYSALWGENGEKWDPRGRLPDFSFVGYKSGEESYHYPSTIVNVTSFGAIPDDSISDYNAIMSAINSISSGIVYFPPGRYIIDSIIQITKDSIVLRGAGNDTLTGTHFYFPKNATELGVSGNVSTGGKGYMIEFSGVNAGPSSNITEETKMGDRSITVDNPSLFTVGDIVTISYNGSHPVNGELWDHICNDQNPDWPCSVSWSNGNGGLMMYHTIERIEGNIITLKEPIRLDLRLSWTPIVQLRTSWLIQNCGVEDIFMEHKYIVQPPHLSEPGYNTLGFERSAHCWIHNVTSMNSDNGFMFKTSGYGEMKNITFAGRGGHHGLKFAYSSHCLADTIHFANYDPWYHSFTLTHKANGNVVSNITGVPGIPISTDFHRNTPWETLITNVDNDWNYNSSGVWCAGPNAGKRTVYWNMGGAGFTTYPSWDDYQTTLVGELHIPEKFHSEKGWHENVPALSPSNLYEAQLDRRLNLQPDPLFQLDPFIGDRLNWWERDPSRWMVTNDNGNLDYRLFFSNTPALTGDRLGEYSLLDSVFTGDILISANAKSLEKLNINTSADLALIVNYQDDENYYFFMVSSDASESGIYKAVNGLAIRLATVNVIVTDNNFHRYSFGREGDSLGVYYDYQPIASVFENSFSGGKTGIGSYDDAVAFNNIKLNDIHSTITWTGATSTDWGTVTNWDLGTIPVDSNNIVIPTSPLGGNFPETNALQGAVCNDLMIKSGAHLIVPPNKNISIVGTLLNYAGTTGLILKSDASGTASLLHNTNNVEATVESYIAQDQWHMVSAPVNDALSDVFTGLYLMYFDESDYSWHYITPLDYDLTEGHGFFTWSASGSTGNATVNYTGTLNNGDLTVSGLSFTASQPQADRGWNMVGNPYPSAIHLNSNWTRNNLDATAYIYDGANYLTWNFASDNGTHPNGDIAPGQGFWVKANATGASLTIPQSERKHSTQPFYKTGAQINELLLTVEGNGYSDKMIVQFNDEATTGFDGTFDAWKFRGDEAAPQLYSIFGDAGLTVNVLPFADEGMVIPLALEVGANTNYQLSFNNFEFDNNTKVWLEDLQTDKITEVTPGNSYEFTASVTDKKHRFNLHFGNLLNVDNFHSEDINIYSNGSNIYISSNEKINGRVIIYNLTGKSILSKDIRGSNFYAITVNAATGLYNVTVIEDKSICSHKIYLK